MVELVGVVVVVGGVRGVGGGREGGGMGVVVGRVRGGVNHLVICPFVCQPVCPRD